MTADDAHGLADALERALADLPDHDALTGNAIPRRSIRDDDRCRLWDLEPPPGVAISPFEEFSGPNKATLSPGVCRVLALLTVVEAGAAATAT